MITVKITLSGPIEEACGHCRFFSLRSIGGPMGREVVLCMLYGKTIKSLPPTKAGYARCKECLEAEVKP